MIVVWDVVLSMAFATLEGLAVYALMLYIFRFRLKDYIWQSLIIITLMNIQSYYISENTDLSFISPIINIVFMILFMKCIARLPIVGALVSAVIGYLVFGLIQWGVVYGIHGSLDGINDDDSVRWKVQLLTGVIGLIVSQLLYKFGIGFTNDFERFKFPFERQLVLVISVLFGVAFAAIMYSENLTLAGVFFVVSMGIFLYYAIRKESGR